MKKQIAILGSQGYQSSDHRVLIDCYPWDRLDRIKNLSDYDFVLINLLTLKNYKYVNWSDFHGAMSSQVMAEILGPHGQIIVLGNPDFPIFEGEPQEQPFLRWTGIDFEWDRRPGRTTEEVFEDYPDRNAFGAYLSHLTSWTYTLKQISSRKEDLIEAFGLEQYLNDRRDWTIGAEVSPFFASRSRGVLSAKISVVLDSGVGGRSPSREARFGPIVLLPPTNLSEAESVQLILCEAAGVQITTPEPEWVSGLTAPNQEPIERALKEIEDQVKSLVDLHSTKEKELEIARGPLKLLYSMHDDLEKAVAAALSGLGAEVISQDERKEEDAIISVMVEGQVRHGVVEVKGTERPTLEEKGLRQLTDWVSRAISRNVDAPKGIFVANASATNRPQDRSNPFGANFVKSAASRGFAVIRSEDLFTCFVLQVQGKLDSEEFWRKVFDTDGVFDATRYRSLLNDEPNRTV